MSRVLKLIHLGGFVVSLGSIFTFIVISAVIEGWRRINRRLTQRTPATEL